VPQRTIAVMATLDTKGREAAYIRDCVLKRGHRPLLIDTGLLGEPGAEPDISNREVAEAGGASLDDLRRHANREESGPAMAAGATKVMHDLVASGEVHALLALGGTQGTTLSTSVMRELPYGFPKIMVSTMASGNVGPWVGTSDITMMYSVTDIMGLNPFMRRILANAAGAACGMAEVDIVQEKRKPLVAVTTVGITTRGAMTAAKVLEDAGYETIVFHAVGTGGRAMEEMMRQGLIGAVLVQRDAPRASCRRRRAVDRRRPLGPAAGVLPGRAGSPRLQRAGDRSGKVCWARACPAQPQDHRPPADAGGDGRGRPRGRAAAAGNRKSGGVPDPDGRLRQLRR